MYSARDHRRLIDIPQIESYRSDFRRDSARVLHSPSFRRLQGKLQLFPGRELDFFRNRLTHSLEVGQIAKSIAIRLNETEEFLRPQAHKIDPDLTELAGWCHDLGHPPFGHTGEEALDECMRDSGGFEGNAQTLRILAKIEKRDHNAGVSDSGFDKNGVDARAGLNLTFRSLASVLKYDFMIPRERGEQQALSKGYYIEEKVLVDKIKDAVMGKARVSGSFRTIECSIMDIADDIAYSTYDLEDAFKGGFLSPFDLLAPRPEVVEAVAHEIALKTNQAFSKSKVLEVLRNISQFIIDKDPELAAIVTWMTSRNIAEIGYYRTSFTSELVGQFLNSVQLKPNEQHPALSRVELTPEAFEKVEVLKHFTFHSLTLSPDLRVTHYRGREVTRNLFNILSDSANGGHELLPRDVRSQYEATTSPGVRKRIICDFIAGMTDAYAVEYYGRLTSETPMTLFKRLL